MVVKGLIVRDAGRRSAASVFGFEYVVETPMCTTRPDACGHASFPLAEPICGGEFDGNERA
jgi:hypothetical protein